MKKILILILISAVAALSFACGGNSQNESSAQTQSAAPDESSYEESSGQAEDSSALPEESMAPEESAKPESADPGEEEPSGAAGGDESSADPGTEGSSEPEEESSEYEEESSEEPSAEPSEEEPYSEEPAEESSEAETPDGSSEESSEEPSAEPSKEESSEEPSVEPSEEEPYSEEPTEESSEEIYEESSEEISEEPKDTDVPVITLAPFTDILFISRGGSADLMAGVTGTDATEGDITGRITIDDGGLDSAVPGEYTVTYALKDSAGNESEMERRYIVKQSAVIAEYPIWEGAVPGEKAKPADPKAFGGAWYRKVVSAKDAWTGIEAVVTLPEVVIRRYDGAYDETLPYDPEVKNLDNPSVYLGGNAGSESDVGLSFSRTLYKAGTSNLTKSSFAFRPFWRYIAKEDKDAGGYDVHGGEYAVTANGNNCFANYHWKYTEYYYLPGDTLRISVFSPAPGKLQMHIEVLEVSTLPSSVEIRKKYNWKAPADFISPVFTSSGHGTAGVLAEFKRVNAIDQSGNEGKTAIDTDTAVTNAVWHSTYLYRVIDGQAYRVPMNENRRGEVNAPYDSAFVVGSTAEGRGIGAESVTIAPGN